MLLIEASHIKKSFQRADGAVIEAVRDVSLQVGPGEIVCLLGPNGAGKTTCLRMISGLMSLGGGDLKICGHDAIDHPDKARASLGFMTSQTGLYKRLSVKEMILYYGRLHHLDPKTLQERLDFVIDLMGLADFLDQRCEYLSTGQRQRTSIARTLVHDPQVLVLDEPTLGLDVLSNRVILDFLKLARSQGKGILLSTHHLEEAQRLGDRHELIHQGRIMASGSLDELRGQTSLQDLPEIFLKVAGETV